VPGTYASVTLAAWVRIDGFDYAFNSLLLSDGSARQGALHWQIYRKGSVVLTVKGTRTEMNRKFAVEFKLEPSDFGRWMHFVAVYDGEKKTISHYRDGRLLETFPLDRVVPVAIGDAQIGNWSPYGRVAPTNGDNAENGLGGLKKKIRNLNGRIDDFVILSDALVAIEIMNLYDTGVPSQENRKSVGRSSTEEKRF
jgi:hypothetical protein